jgi:hypothetical protein
MIRSTRSREEQDREAEPRFTGPPGGGRGGYEGGPRGGFGGGFVPGAMGGGPGGGAGGRQIYVSNVCSQTPSCFHCDLSRYVNLLQ